jgi:hypothetical protein
MKLVITENQLRGIVEMSLRAYQGTPHDFESFDINKVGQGEGTQWFGWGLYFTDSESIANYYAKSVTDVKNKELLSKSDLVYKGYVITGKGVRYKTLFDEIVGVYPPNTYIVYFVYSIIHELIKDILSSLKGEKKWDNIRFIGNREEVVNYIKENVEKAIDKEEERIENPETTFFNYKNLRSMLDYQKEVYQNFINGGNPKYIEMVNKIVNLKREDFKLTSDDKIQKQGYSYNVTIHKDKTPDQYDYLSWYDDLTPNQKQKIINQIKTEKLKKRNFYIVKPIDEETEIQPRFYLNATDAKNGLKNLNSKYYIPGLGVNLSNFEIVKGSFTMEDLNKSVKDFYTQLSGLLGSPKEASMFLLRAGIDGIKYPTNTIAGGESQGTNYVVFDQNQLTIEKKNKVDL